MPPPPRTQTAFEQARNAVRRSSAERRRRAGAYANLVPLPGSSRIPRRLLSDVGFYQDTGFSYGVVAPRFIRREDPDIARGIQYVTLCPYGYAEDAASFTAERRPQLRPLPAATRWYVPQAVDPLTTHNPRKTTALVVAMSTNTSHGPALHALVDRLGGVRIQADNDAVLAAEANGFRVGLESAWAVDVENFEARIELPFTPVQLASLSVLIAKLRTAATAIPLTFGNTGGFRYNPIDSALIPPEDNFVDGEANRYDLDYSAVLPAAFLARLAAEPTFDLATDVFRPVQRSLAGPPPSARSTIAASIGQTDTLGARSMLLAIYEDAAGTARAHAMAASSRSEVFVRRAQEAHHDSDNNEGDANRLSAPDTPVPAEDPGAYAYDYQTGLWSDGVTY